jgi:Flp pilus assembly protein TadG
MIPRRARGQALVEFAVVIPVFLALLFGILDFGRVIWANNSLAHAAREGARYAIVHGGSATTACPVGPPGPDVVIPTSSTSCPYPSPSKQAIRDAVTQAALAAGRNVTVTVCYGTNCTGDTDVTGATNARGTPVTIVVTSELDLIVPALVGWRSFGVKGSSTMLVNH